MRIAVYAPVLGRGQISAFDQLLVRTLALIFQTHKKDSFIIIGSVKGTYTSLNNVDHFEIRDQPQSAIGKRIWWEIVLPRALKKIKADLFISFDDRCSSAPKIPQALLIADLRRSNRRSIINAGSILVAGKSVKDLLSEKYGADQEKICVLQPFADPGFKPVGEDQKEKIKEQYSSGREFFLFHNSNNRETFIELLKAFSLFKKRQQSNLKLVVIGKSNDGLKHSLANYKYRDDVALFYPGEKDIANAITASAYAVLITAASALGVWEGFEALQAGSPVITINKSDLHEIAGDAVLTAENNSAKSIGEKMMQIYIDEKLRTSLIEKGRSRLQAFSLEKTSGQVWQAFMKALN